MHKARTIKIDVQFVLYGTTAQFKPLLDLIRTQGLFVKSVLVVLCVYFWVSCFRKEHATRIVSNTRLHAFFTSQRADLKGRVRVYLASSIQIVFFERDTDLRLTDRIFISHRYHGRNGMRVLKLSVEKERAQISQRPARFAVMTSLREIRVHLERCDERRRQRQGVLIIIFAVYCCSPSFVWQCRPVSSQRSVVRCSAHFLYPR